MKLIVSAAVIAGVVASAITAPQSRPLTFKDVKPIFAKRCVACHAASSPAGAIRLDTYEGVMKGGEHGKAVLAKNSAGSRLMKMVKGTLQPRMPMDAAPLTQAELEKISKWISQGAKK